MPEEKIDLHIILDIDGTLISEVPHDIFHSGEEYEIDDLVKPRPYLKEFLHACFSHAHKVSIWTAANNLWFKYVYRTHIKPVITELKVELDFIYCGDKCSTVFDPDPETEFPQIIKIKKLSKIWKKKYSTYTKHNTIIIDDSPNTYIKNYGNAVPIKTYTIYHKNDEELKKLAQYLINIKQHYVKNKTIRNMNKKYY